jgi:adenylate cyclase
MATRAFQSTQGTQATLPTVQLAHLTVFFCDIVDSTHLYERLGDKLALDEIRRSLQLIRREVEPLGGKVVKTLGDGMLMTFEVPADALAAAQAITTMLFTRSSLEVRMGVHFGPVMMHPGDVFGDAVNIAARLASLAAVGQALTTRETVDELPAGLRTRCRSLGAHYIKGKTQAVEVHEILLQGAEELTIMMPVQAHPSKGLRLQLIYQGATRYLVAPVKRLTLGRGAQADIVLADPHASRAHAVLEQRADKFALIDQSSNGTYVRMANMEYLRLSRQEMLLQGSGEIRFSAPDLPGSSASLSFAIEGAAAL